jgi:transposase-like protein
MNKSNQYLEDNKIAREVLKREMLKQECYKLTRLAIKHGIITRPSACPSCNKKRKVHCHHPNYAEPYKYMWLCSKCHDKWHRLNGPAAWS